MMFHKHIKRVAVKAAVLLFFIIAVTAWISRCSPATCAMRAMMGAVAAYYIVSIAGKLCVKVLIHALVEDQMRKHQNHEQK